MSRVRVKRRAATTPTMMLSRRQCLACAGAVGGSLLLTACAGVAAAPPREGEGPGTSAPNLIATALPPQATATPTPTPTPAPTPTPTPPLPLLLNPQFHRQHTPATDALGPDGYTWAQGQPIVVDRNEKIIALAQRAGGQGHLFVCSNDGGATWQDGSLPIDGMIRAALAYDDQNDLLHALWLGQSAEAGITYRRYTIRRDTSGNIGDIDADPSSDFCLDGQTTGTEMTYQHPIIHWLAGDEIGNAYGALLCVWSARNARQGLAGNEVRAAFCRLDNTATDGTAANWSAPGAPSTTPIGSVPTVPYTRLVANTAPGVIYPSLGRKRLGKHQGDLYLCYADGGTGAGGVYRWCWRRFPWDSITKRWGESTPEMIITSITRNGTDRGYEYKYQLGTKLVEDPRGDRLYFGFASWRDDIAGDTWGFVAIEAKDTLGPLVDVYSCQGRFVPELYALTGDLAFDTVYDRLVVAYVRSGTGQNNGALRIYDGTTPTEPETRFFTTADVDIPLLWQEPRTGRCRFGQGVQQQLLILFRDTNGQAAPYRGWCGTLDWATQPHSS